MWLLYGNLTTLDVTIWQQNDATNKLRYSSENKLVREKQRNFFIVQKTVFFYTLFFRTYFQQKAKKTYLILTKLFFSRRRNFRKLFLSCFKVFESCPCTNVPVFGVFSSVQLLQTPLSIFISQLGSNRWRKLASNSLTCSVNTGCFLFPSVYWEKQLDNLGSFVVSCLCFYCKPEERNTHRDQWRSYWCKIFFFFNWVNMRKRFTVVLQFSLNFTKFSLRFIEMSLFSSGNHNIALKMDVHKKKSTFESNNKCNYSP